MPDLVVNPAAPGGTSRVIKDLQDTFRKMVLPRALMKKQLRKWGGRPKGTAFDTSPFSWPAACCCAGAFLFTTFHFLSRRVLDSYSETASAIFPVTMFPHGENPAFWSVDRDAALFTLQRAAGTLPPS